ncbi:hypothetical protein EYF80_020786 [Liparis tanakae]|uniref:Uncharacterized protein n=1 Tax=Liparis tanakae TaxID=230148 RepID=A0A4Z2HUC6_9TELE|nr:hypothetical protein EYF80_020786 [Liparis tanakae]
MLSPSGSSRRVTPSSRSARLKACSRFSWLLCRYTWLMSTRGVVHALQPIPACHVALASDWTIAYLAKCSQANDGQGPRDGRRMEVPESSAFCGGTV